MYLTDLIGQEITADNTAIGYSYAVCFSHGCKKVTALLCADEEEEDFFLPLSPDAFKGGKLVMPRSRKSKNTGTVYSPFSRPIYRSDGVFLGFVTDMVLSDFKVTALQAGEKVFPAEEVTAFGDCILIGQKAKGGQKKEQEKTPSSARQRRPLVLGRTVKADILDEEGNLLFARGTAVTPKILRQAVKFNRLIELTAKVLSPQTE